MDLIELSGGTYEQPKMLELEGIEPSDEIKLRASTQAREAFFQAFAAELKDEVSAPIMVTGGFRSASGMATAIRVDGISAIGIGRPLCGDPQCTQKLLDSGEDLPRFEQQLGSPNRFFGVNSPIKLIKTMASFAVMAWYYDQILLMADGKDNDPDPGSFRRFLALQGRETRWLKARKAWLAGNR